MKDREVPPADEAIIALLIARDGLETTVRLCDERVFSVHNSAWGYDLGDEYAHLTTNISPGSNGVPIDFFHTIDVEEIANGRDDKLLWPPG